MPADRRIVLVGAGQCSASAAASLRSRGFEGELVMIGAEAQAPYERPPLSKDYLLGRSGPDQLRIFAPQWFADNDVELLLSTSVTRLDPGSRTLELSSGAPLRYDAVLIATGGRPRRLPGIESERLLCLHDRGDCDRLACHLRGGDDLVILGGGFIGCEVAAAARQSGVEVTVLELRDHPLEVVLGASVGQVLSDIHREAGVKLRTGERVLSVSERSDGLLVQTDRGQLECAVLLVAVGLEPNTEWLRGSGVRCDNGVRVDELCATNVDGVFAAGDVSSHYHPTFGMHVRVEHYDNAIKQGSAAAASMLGSGTPYVDVHWFWSDQYEHNLQSVGIADGCDRLVVRGDARERSFSVFYLRQGVVRSVFALNRSQDVAAGRRMVLGALRPDPEQLRDPEWSLRQLATAPR